MESIFLNIEYIMFMVLVTLCLTTIIVFEENQSHEDNLEDAEF